MIALDRKYHKEHFRCVTCNLILDDAQVCYEHEGEPVCEYHFVKSFARSCSGCGFTTLESAIEDPAGNEWHPLCYAIFSTVSSSIRSQIVHGAATELQRKLSKDVQILPSDRERRELHKQCQRVEELSILGMSVLELSDRCIQGFLQTISSLDRAHYDAAALLLTSIGLYLSYLGKAVQSWAPTSQMSCK